jgi:putative Flp pilus-assembly TadE/G-like protein
VAPIPREHGGRAVAAAGQTLPLVVVFMFSILVFAGLVIDFGNASRVQKALQASADASPAAGAGQLTLSYPPITANATAQAQKYGSQTGGVNPIAGVPAAKVTQNVSFSQNYQTPETPMLPAETALQEIASPGAQYFYDLPSATSLTGIFQQIACDIAGGTARIVQ